MVKCLFVDVVEVIIQATRVVRIIMTVADFHGGKNKNANRKRLITKPNKNSKKKTNKKIRRMIKKTIMNENDFQKLKIVW